jgi:colanic acid/amylovoran biosynthesis glycosyltransferase
MIQRHRARADERSTVMHFTARWLPASEGFLHDLVSHLERRGVVVASGRLENGDRYSLDDGRVPYSLATVQALAPPAVRQKALTARLVVLARQNRVGLLHAHHGYRFAQVQGVARRARLPMVLSLHGDDVTGLLERQPDAYDGLHAAPAAVVVPSRFLEARATNAGFPGERIHVIPSGVDTTWFAPTPLPTGPPEVLFVGRFVEMKGLDVLARAWPLVTASVPTARLRLLGFGPLEPVARAIPGRVEVVLSPTRHQVREAMRRARLVVSPSRTARGGAESLLVVNLEAQASARPVVTTRHGGIPEFVDEGHSALLVPENDPGALAGALTAVLTDDALASRMAAHGPGWAAAFDVHRTARRVDALYDDLLRTSLGTRPGSGVMPATVAGA